MIYMAFSERNPRKETQMKNKGWDKIKQAWEENPFMVLGVAVVAVNVASKLMDANTRRTNAQAWEMEVNRRNRMSRR
jgi:hypothetical protein